MRFNRVKFYEGMRQFERGLTQGQVNGINYILDSMEKDPFLKKVEHAAYMFATIKPETAHTYQPIHEYGGHKYFVKRYGSQTKVGKRLGNDTPEEGATYAGRGNVQLTGESNYEKAEEALRKYYPEIVAEFEARTGKKFDLTVGDQLNDAGDADIASDPAIAYAIMSYGMRTGMFTGRKLSDYDFNDPKEVRNARKIINGLDHADMIQGYYNRFLPILKQSLISAASSQPQAQTADSISPESETAESTVPPTIQNAEQIINTGDSTPPAPAPVDVTLNAPQGMGSVQTATKVTVLGITVPPFLLVVIETIKGWISDGFLDAKEIGNTVVSLIKDNSKYILIAVGLVVVVIIIKKITRELIFLVTVITHAIPGWNSVTVIAPEKVVPEKKWYQFYK